MPKRRLKLSVSEMRKQRKISSLKRHARYSLDLIAKRNNATSKNEDYIFISGFVFYFAVPFIAQLSGLLWLVAFREIIFGATLVLPILASYIEVYQLKATLTLSLYVVPNNPDTTQEVRIRLIDCRFDDRPLDTPADVTAWMQKNNADLVTTVRPPRLTRLRRSATSEEHSNDMDVKNEVASRKIEELVQVAKSKDLKVWGATIKGNKIKFMFLLPDDPRKWLKPREEKTRLNFGWGKVPHAPVWALEGDAIESAVMFEGTVVDVTFPLFLPFFTRGGLAEWIGSGEFYIPGPVANRFAEYVRKLTDGHATEKYVKSLERERDDAQDAYDRLLLSDQFDRIQTDNEEGVTREFRAKQGLSSDDIILLIFVAITALMSGYFLRPLIDAYLLQLGVLT